MADENRKSKPSSSSASQERKVVIKSADMNDEMQKEAIACAIAAFEKQGVEKEVAEYIKKEFDKKHGSTWHCIVGRNFVGDINSYALSEDSLASPNEKTLLAWLQDVCEDSTSIHPSLLEGSYVTHETNHFVYFYLDQKAVLLFKSG